MKKNGSFVGILAIILVFCMMVIGCDNGTTDNPKTETFSGIAGVKTYTLKVTDETSYVLTVSDGTDTKTSSGSAAKSGDTWTLTPSGGGEEFTVTIGSGSITSMGGSITYDNNTSEPSPETLTPPPTNAELLIGTWNNSDAEVTWVKFETNGKYSQQNDPSSLWDYTATDTKIQYVGDSKQWNYTITRNGNTLTLIAEFLEETYTREL